MATVWPAPPAPCDRTVRERQANTQPFGSGETVGTARALTLKRRHDPKQQQQKIISASAVLSHPSKTQRHNEFYTAVSYSLWKKNNDQEL